MGWSGLMNGKLLSKAEASFDVFVTSDQNLSFQQNLQKYRIAVIVLCPPRNQLEDLKSLIPSFLKSLSNIESGRVVRIRS